MTQALYFAYEAIRDFLEQGGPILSWIGVLTFVMWVLIIERIVYFRSGYRRQVREVLKSWKGRKERQSWNARQIRAAMISRTTLEINQGLSLIQTLVAIAPLLGLMGTVTGMIEVFEVMALLDNANPRSMAAGVSKATIPTMAGMVAALSGVFASTWLLRSARRKIDFLQSQLTIEV
jgi:biopolymer transport protein ExbB